MSMIIKNIVRGEMTLSMSIHLCYNGSAIPPLSIEDQIISSTQFSLRVSCIEMQHGCNWYSVFLKFSKFQCDIDETILVTSEAMRIKSRTFKNENTWVLVHNDKFEIGSEMDIKIQVLKPILNKNIVLYDDVSMTDFELRADDGRVRFHRVVLALSSPVLKTILSGKWKKTAQGHVNMEPGISKNTVQQFKDFIYKSVVPENVSLELLSLASGYMMTELEEICVEKIVDTLTSENIWSLLEYCASHKLKKLLMAILNRFKYGQIDDKVFIGL